ncbi:MAG: c-type cytochrome [Acidobacteriaceae bacterium]
MRKISPVLLLTILLACAKHPSVPPEAKPSATPAALVEVSGSKQAGRLGAPLDQPIVVQVNDDKGAAVQNARVTITGAPGLAADPASGLTDSSGQFTSLISAPGISGHFQVIATTKGQNGEPVELKLDEIALGYEQVLGQQLNARYCSRCHDPESTPERVSNMDNLDPKPHAFTEGDTLNKISDADLALIITRGGAALNISSSMPPYGYTLNNSEIHALVSYVRAIADPPYRPSGMVYANK